MAGKTNYTINGVDYYRIRRTVGHKLNEKGEEVPIIKYFYGSNKSDALRKYEEFKEKRRKGVDTSGQYFGVVADNWLFAFFVNDQALAERTRTLYLTCWNRYVKPSTLYSMPLSDVGAATLQDFYNNLECPSLALISIHKLMKRLYKYLEREELARNITNSVVLPAAKKEPAEKKIVTWTDEEVSLILNGFDKAQKGFRLRFLIELGYYTGARISELLGLKYEDFDLKEETLTLRRQIIEKTTFDRDGNKKEELCEGKLKSSSSYRIIPINNYIIKAFKRHSSWHKEEQLQHGYRTDFIFTTSSGGFYFRKSAAQSLNRYYKRIGVEPKGFHTYRHTFGTNLCGQGVPIQVASSLLGHADVSVTAKYYVSVDMDMKRKALKMLSK